MIRVSRSNVVSMSSNLIVMHNAEALQPRIYRSEPEELSRPKRDLLGPAPGMLACSVCCTIALPQLCD